MHTPFARSPSVSSRILRTTATDKPHIMPRSLLQSLGALARYDDWQRHYDYPLDHYGRGFCRLRAARGRKLSNTGGSKGRRTGRKRRGKLVVFKRTGPGTTLNRKAGNPPCGLPSCRVCSVFIEMYITSIEDKLPIVMQLTEQSEVGCTDAEPRNLRWS